MPSLPPAHQQILSAHAALIHLAVRACHNRDHRPELDAALRAAAENGWTELARTIRAVVDGRRDPAILHGLDEEDQVIVDGILRGLNDPATLPDPNTSADPTMAAPGLAHMIQAAARGDVQALQLLSHMAEQMSRAGGQMGRLAAAIRPMINGERDPARLCRGMTPEGRGLVLDILEELGKTGIH